MVAKILSRFQPSPEPEELGYQSWHSATTSTSLMSWIAVCCLYEPCRKQTGAIGAAGPLRSSMSAVTCWCSRAAPDATVGFGFKRPKNDRKLSVREWYAI